MTDWFRARLGRMRVSTIVLIVVFVALFWINQTVEPDRPPTPTPAVVPPGFVPDPNYTWVPRTNVRRPKEPEYTTTTPPTTTTTSPTTTTPTSPTTETPTTSTAVVDPDGPGPLPPTTQTLTPTTTAPPGSPTAPTPTTTAPS